MNKFIRYVIMLPVAIVLISLMYYLFALLLGLFINKDNSTLVILFFALGGVAFYLFTAVSGVIGAFLKWIAPDGKFTAWVISILSITLTAMSLIELWGAQGLMAWSIIYTALLLELTAILIYGAITINK